MKFLVIALTLLIASMSQGQQATFPLLKAGDYSPINSSAQLEVKSTSLGFLLPRMTTTQKNAISSPSAGLQVYDTTLGAVCEYNGSSWQTLSTFLSPMTTAGDMIYENGTPTAARLAIGTTGQVLNVNSSGFPGWTTNIFGNASNVTGIVAVSNGGTGNTTTQAAFNNLSPTTTKGDMIYYDGSNDSRLAPGTTNQILNMSGGVPAWTSTFTGNVTGNASTATALAASPSPCPSNQYSTGIAANGNASCSQVAYSQLTGTPTPVPTPFVLRAGDTMTGTLTVQTSNDFLDGIDSSSTNWIKIDSGGNVTSRGGILSLGNTVVSRAGIINLNGGTSGTITIQPQSAAGTYNFNLPISVGSSNSVLASGGGGSTAMTWIPVTENETASTLVYRGPDGIGLIGVGGSNGIFFDSNPSANNYAGMALTGSTSYTILNAPGASGVDYFRANNVTMGSATGGTGWTFNLPATFGVNATTQGSISIANSATLGTSITILNLGNTTAYNFDLPTTAGNSGQVLTSAGGTASMTWTSPLTNPMTGTGDMIIGGSSGSATRLAAGSTGAILNMSSGSPTWLSVGTSGQVLTMQGVPTWSSGSYTAPTTQRFTSNILSTGGSTANTTACITSLGSTAGIVVGAYVYDTKTPAAITAGTAVTAIGTCGSGPSNSVTISVAAGATTQGDTFQFGGVYSMPTNPAPLYITVEGVGSGGGGSGGGGSPGLGIGNTSYSATFFGSSGANQNVLNGGGGGTVLATAAAGGACTLGTASNYTTLLSFAGGAGSPSTTNGVSGTSFGGGPGGVSFFGGAGAAGYTSSSAPVDAQPNSGSGGGGGGSGTNNDGGGGGAAGCYAKIQIGATTTTYPWILGIGGTGGATGTSGTKGSRGGDGFLLIRQYFQ
jgi:hypothetical protein